MGRFENSKKKLREKKNQDLGEINRDQIQEETRSSTPLKEKELFCGGYASMSSDIHSCDISERLEYDSLGPPVPVLLLTWTDSTVDFIFYWPRFSSFQSGESIRLAGLIPCSWETTERQTRELGCGLPTWKNVTFYELCNLRLSKGKARLSGEGTLYSSLGPEKELRLIYHFRAPWTLQSFQKLKKERPLTGDSLRDPGEPSSPTDSRLL